MTAKAHEWQVLVGHDEQIEQCAVSDDERVVLSAAADNSVFVWETDNGTVTHNLAHHNRSRVSSIAITSDGTVAFTGCLSIILSIFGRMKNFHCLLLTAS